ncbi:CoA pyrophosphatase [Rhodococcus rhodnii]|uniref:CoA pyrophosphatase n=1 Tax=Rhodococcus rhodnii TaxID=38312 RepID=A0A6P2CLL6_9NOCA|nr:CoA pyrophosphatase [Rhodococcus rhodnii]
MTPAAIEDALGRFPLRETPIADGAATRAAAVAIVLVRGADGQVMPLTRRPGRMRAHPGQFALPGGSLDPGETAAEAARRELEEELGITVGPGGVLGRLDDYVTRSGYVISPVVLWSDADFRDIVPSPDEVAAVYDVTLDEIDVDPVFVAIDESPRPVVQWPLRGHRIHAPTGAIVHQFREVVLRGRDTRVADYEQPVFAWR